MTEHDFLMQYASRPQADRAAFTAAMRAYKFGGDTQDNRDRLIAKALGLTVNTDTETDDCNCPAYSLDSWAIKAIDGREYRRKTGPDVRFAFLMGDGGVLEVRPSYEPTSEFIAGFRDIAPDLKPILPSDSNWQLVGDYALYIYDRPQARIASHRGFFGGSGYSLWTDGPQEVTDEVTATIWRVHRNKAEAFVGLPFCGVCRRPITDDTSRALGIGPDCARLLGIPHGRPPAREAKVLNEKARAGGQPERAMRSVTHHFAVDGGAHEL